MSYMVEETGVPGHSGDKRAFYPLGYPGLRLLGRPTKRSKIKILRYYASTFLRSFKMAKVIYRMFLFKSFFIQTQPNFLLYRRLTYTRQSSMTNRPREMNLMSFKLTFKSYYCVNLLLWKCIYHMTPLLFSG